MMPKKGYWRKWPSHRRDYQRAYTREQGRKWRQLALVALGNKCIRCDFSDTRALQIDHVNGGGNKERFRRGSTQYHRQVVRECDSGKYQLLCANCNWIKRVEQKEQNQYPQEVIG